MGVPANPFLKLLLPGIVLFSLAGPAVCQIAQIDVFNAPVVPQTIKYEGIAVEHARETVEIVFRIYSIMEGGEPLWSETQSVSIGADGKYSVFLGTDTSGGLPHRPQRLGRVLPWFDRSDQQSPCHRIHYSGDKGLQD